MNEADIKHVVRQRYGEAARKVTGDKAGGSCCSGPTACCDPITSDLALFSLQSALAADDRFDQVGWDESRRWYLRRLEPAEALDIPEALRISGALSEGERPLLPPELRQIDVGAG